MGRLDGTKARWRGGLNEHSTHEVMTAGICERVWKFEKTMILWIIYGIYYIYISIIYTCTIGIYVRGEDDKEDYVFPGRSQPWRLEAMNSINRHQRTALKVIFRLVMTVG